VRVLLVEDDPDRRRVLALLLGAGGHIVVECRSAGEARRAGPCDLALVDRELPDGDGLEPAATLGGCVYPLTGDELDAAALRAARSRGVRVLTKPIRPRRLGDLLRAVGPRG
jgi:CheY-like chemotaxis protein